jgi:hypothetical protein
VKEGQYDHRDDGPRGLKYDDSSRDGGSMSKRTTVGEASRAQGHDAKPEQGLTNGHGPSKTSRQYVFRILRFDQSTNIRQTTNSSEKTRTKAGT